MISSQALKSLKLAAALAQELKLDSEANIQMDYLKTEVRNQVRMMFWSAVWVDLVSGSGELSVESNMNTTMLEIDTKSMQS